MKKLLIIPDGHRRYAETLGLSSAIAYQRGAEAAVQIVRESCKRSLIKHLALFPLAQKNFSERTPEAILAILDALHYFVAKVVPLTEDGVLLTYRGRLDRIRNDTRQLIQSTLARDGHADSHSLTLELLIDYDGHAEFTTLSESDIKHQLDHPYDIVLRTGGHFRLSGAPLLECYDAEMVTLPLMFPELTPLHVEQVITTVSHEKHRRTALALLSKTDDMERSDNDR